MVGSVEAALPWGVGLDCGIGMLVLFSAAKKY